MALRHGQGPHSPPHEATCSARAPRSQRRSVGAQVVGTWPLLWQQCGSARPSRRLPRRVWAQELAGSVLGGGKAQPVVAPSVLGERQGQGGLEGGLLVDAVVLEDGAELGGTPWSLRATPARSPQTDLSAVPPPCRCSASRSWVLGTLWQLVGDDLAALRTLHSVTEGWTDCARWTRGTKAVLSPQIQGWQGGGNQYPHISTIRTRCGQSGGGSLQGRVPAGWQGTGRADLGAHRRGASAGGMWLFPSVHWRGLSPRRVCVPRPQCKLGRRCPCNGASPRGPPE